MIQRIQSIFLLVVVLCGVGLAFLYGNDFSVKNYDSTINLNMIFSIPIILSGITIFLALISIFLYKKRTTQMRLCIGLIVLNILLLFCSVVLSRDIKYILLPLIAIVFSLLARRYIKKDEELVRSADRIR